MSGDTQNPNGTLGMGPTQGDMMGHYGIFPPGQPALLDGGQTMPASQPYGQRGSQYGVGGAPSGLSGMAAQANAPRSSGLARFGANVNAQQPAPYTPQRYTPQPYSRPSLVSPGSSGAAPSGSASGPGASGASEGVGTQGGAHGLGSVSPSTANAMGYGVASVLGMPALGPAIGGFFGSQAGNAVSANSAAANASVGEAMGYGVSDAMGQSAADGLSAANASVGEAMGLGIGEGESAGDGGGGGGK